MKAGEKLNFDDAPSDLKRKEKSTWIENEAVKRMYALRDELQAEHPGRK